MSVRAAATLLAVTVGAVGLACGHSEKSVVDQYFNAVRSGDTQTLSSFAAVTFDKKPERWAVKDTVDEQKVPAPLPELAKKLADAEKGLADNKKAAGAYNLDHYAQIEEVKAAQKKGGAMPPKLQPVSVAWTKFNETDREMKKAVAQAKDALEKEKRSVARSVGQVDGVETLQGEMINKQIEVDLTIEGKVVPYLMTVRKYDLKRESGPKVNSRWVVQSIQPKV